MLKRGKRELEKKDKKYLFVYLKMAARIAGQTKIILIPI